MEKKNYTLWIIIAGAVLVLGIAYYYLIGSTPDEGGEEGSPCKSDDGRDGVIQGGVCVPPHTVNGGYVAPVVTPISSSASQSLALRSTLVNQGNTSVAQSPSVFYNNINLSQTSLGSFNLATAKGTNPALIHFITGFINQCPAFVWYKNWLYSYRGTETDSNTGAKTCYYKIDKASFPKEIKVLSNAGQCGNFKLFTSGIEYKFTEKRTDKYGNAQVEFCIYKKQ